jgi:hypothetical protein
MIRCFVRLMLLCHADVALRIVRPHFLGSILIARPGVNVLGYCKISLIETADIGTPRRNRN